MDVTTRVPVIKISKSRRRGCKRASRFAYARRTVTAEHKLPYRLLSELHFDVQSVVRKSRAKFINVDANDSTNLKLSEMCRKVICPYFRIL